MGAQCPDSILAKAIELILLQHTVLILTSIILLTRNAQMRDVQAEQMVQEHELIWWCCSHCHRRRVSIRF